MSTTLVSAGSISAARPTGAAAGAAPAPGTSAPPGGSASGAVPTATNVITQTASDFWRQLEEALKAIVTGEGRSVVVSPQSGVVVVRARQRELEDVASYLRATQQSVDRQVLLEAKILEVELKDQYQAGVNWAAFSRSPQVTPGFSTPGAALAARGVAPVLSAGSVNAAPGSALNVGTNAPGAMFALAVQTSRFAALLSFLEIQGSVHVLSSPRIATANNQKAVLKVGTEDYFVTDLRPGTFTTVGAQLVQQPPSVTLQPFFSGVVLDVTPQVDAQGLVRLHVRPSVSETRTVEKSINLGDRSGTLTLPLASNSASETDSMVLARDGQVVVIGGLMRQSSGSDGSRLPGLGDLPVVGGLFRQTGRTALKRELVILLLTRQLAIMVKAGVPMLLVAGMRAVLATPTGRLGWDYRKLRLPVIGSILAKGAVARFCVGLATASRSGLPVDQAFTLVSRVVDNAFYAEQIRNMRVGIERGESILRVTQASGLFQPMELQMISVGEDTGALDEMLDQVAELYQNDVDYEVARLRETIEPVLLMLIGGIVLVLMLGIFLPLWDLGQMAR